MRTRFLLAAAAALAAAPALAQQVNVYSYRQPFLILPLTDAFTEETGIEVNVAYLDKGMIERLQAEGDRSPADLIMTVDISRLTNAVDAGVTQPVETETLTENVPAQYRDPEGSWYALTMRARIVYASKERVDPDEITTYEALADPKWKGRICIRSGLHPYNVALTSAVIEHHGIEDARDWLEGLKTNLARKPQGNDRAQIKAVWAGQCDIAIGNTYYLGKMLTDPDQKEWAQAVSPVFPEFESGGTHVNISGMALTKAAPHREDAVRMMEFLTTHDAQEIYAHTNFEYPIAPGTEADEMVQGWGEFTPDDVDLTTIADHRAEALRLMEEVDFDG